MKERATHVDTRHVALQAIANYMYTRMVSLKVQIMGDNPLEADFELYYMLN